MILKLGFEEKILMMLKIKIFVVCRKEDAITKHCHRKIDARRRGKIDLIKSITYLT